MRSLVIIRYVAYTSQRQTLRSQDEPFGLLQNNILEQNTLEKSEPVAVSRRSAHIARFTATATRLNMFIPVAVSLRPSPTVAARRQGITHQAILCNWLVADNRVASCRLV